MWVGRPVLGGEAGGTYASATVKPACEDCGAPLPSDARAFVCSYDCTFCAACAKEGARPCPNCGNELVRRARRPDSEGPPKPRSGGLDFWCELASTYTYLAAERIESLAARRHVEVAWSPFLLGPIFAASGWTTSPFEVYPSKGRYMWRDVERTADALGIAFKRPAVFPRNTVLASRVAILGVARGWGAAFARRALAANFAEDRDIGAVAVIDELLRELGLDGATIREEADSPAWRPRLREATARASALGIFGAPTFIVEGEMFWGNDRLEQALAWAARSERPDRESV
jgi:2-hydroxychromene-2-carboxylate isomerase